MMQPVALVMAVSSILLCATIAEARGWRGIVPLHSTRSEVEKLLGPPTEQINSYSVFYRTPNETVLIYYAEGRPCGIGEKYSQWRVARNTVTGIFITPNPGSPLSHLSIDENRYRKFTGGHTPDTQYLSASEGELFTVFETVVKSISYFPAADDSYLECPGLPKANLTNCEYLPDAFDSLDDISLEQEKQRLDNFLVALLDKKAIAYIIAYGGKRARADEAMKRANRARQYLVDVRGFPNDHIKVIDGGYRQERALVLYVVFDGVCPPIPAPTVDPRDVEIIRGGRARKNCSSSRPSSSTMRKKFLKHIFMSTAEPSSAKRRRNQQPMGGKIEDL
jgi:hypothetical protein